MKMGAAGTPYRESGRTNMRSHSWVGHDSTVSTAGAQGAGGVCFAIQRSVSHVRRATKEPLRRLHARSLKRAYGSIHTIEISCSKRGCAQHQRNLMLPLDQIVELPFRGRKPRLFRAGDACRLARKRASDEMCETA